MNGNEIIVPCIKSFRSRCCACCD